MLISFLLVHPLLVAFVWAGMYIFDFSATLWLARLYQNNLARHFTHEGGVEMNPVFEKDIAGLRLISPRFLILLTVMTALLVFLGMLDPGGPDFEFVMGAFLLLWSFIDLRHLRNIYFYLHLKSRPAAVDGHIRQTYWLDQRLVAYDAFAFGVVCGIAGLVSERPFFLGGLLICFLLALRHFLLANRKPKVV